ncbi:MAG: NAD(P)H-hydrate epimerase [Bacteroidota bacterium]|nr:NAD(P)H-hydrate epimerase [Bacteroidota bacterium]
MTKKVLAPVPFVSRFQMEAIFKIMNEKYSIDSIQMMENAGRTLAHLASMLFLENKPEFKKILILTGTGGNGAGVLTAARYLHNHGAQITVFTTREPEQLSPETARQLEALIAMNCRVIHGMPELAFYEHFDLIIDGILGCNINGEPYGWAKTFIEMVTETEVPVLSFDIPSGIDPDKGMIYPKYIKPTATMTIGLPKSSFAIPETRDILGRLFVADIGIPPDLFKQYFPDIDTTGLFSLSEIIEI